MEGDYKSRRQQVIDESLKYSIEHDEKFVMEAITKTLGGKCYRATPYEDRRKHIDIWWESPRRGKIGIDVKGVKKNTRSNAEKDDTMQWIEIVNNYGNPGWIYGESEYIAFMTNKNILFVKTTDLQPYANEKTKGKSIVNQCPKEYYVPYQRSQFGRKDVVFKVPIGDLEEMAHFTLEY